MADKNSSAHEHRIPTGSEWTIPDDSVSGGRPRRRTLVQGAAWTIPVVAAAFATPALAASNAAALEFVNGPYALQQCGELTGVQVRATQNGQPAPDGSPIRVTLPAGFTFSDGSTSGTFPTSGGTATLPAITTDSSTPGAITATWNGLVDSEQISVTPLPTGAEVWQNEGLFASYPSVPSTATALGGNYFLTPDGTLYYGNDIVQTGAASAATSLRVGSDGHWVNVVQASGGSRTYRDGVLVSSLSSTGASVTPLGANYYLTNGSVKSLYYNETLVAENVASAVAGDGSGDRATVVFASGGSAVFLNGVQESTIASTGSGSTALGAGYFLSGSNLFFGEQFVASGVSSAHVHKPGAAAGSESTVDIVLDGGTAQTYTGSTLSGTWGSVPSGATALGDEFFRSGDAIYYRDTVIRRGVSSASTMSSDGAGYVNVVLSGTCPA
ncbi:hypothetical protein [Rathayibacter tanaceti]|uniref:Uncharacterized protein n=2 Tax=Rathayibacter tanaceti TaxID=1671680 RepID=A0A166IC95_9MICO|nr:hypothetical protein [Rathayibacter tanaceti]KZX22136.1 hypothetical protein ACH61_00703 [Rathayibacter tanaceti]QHC54479.1 hypothetical protein GSU10_01575 [Rathayibacter tanaceti]TCO35032.1 hypothetical protein EV639_10936 [Rathayibacter tanaceti]